MSGVSVGCGDRCESRSGWACTGNDSEFGFCVVLEVCENPDVLS